MKKSLKGSQNAAVNASKNRRVWWLAPQLPHPNGSYSRLTDLTVR